MSGKLKVLFLCTGYSCRSQMAEGWARDAATTEEALGHYRRVRDEIRAFVENLPTFIDDLDN